MIPLAETRARCPELADYFEQVGDRPLTFDGAHAIEHSARNHVHLWALEWWSDHHAWIDLDYRVAFAAAILERWQGRMKGLAPYRAQGYRLYVYEDLAPTLSAVAETPQGCPYGGNLTFVRGIREVMEVYSGRSWRGLFAADPRAITQERLLEEVERHAGSIGAPTANALGLTPGSLRKLIGQMRLEDRVNALRKRHKRRPAQFASSPDPGPGTRVFELRLPPGYT